MIALARELYRREWSRRSEVFVGELVRWLSPAGRMRLTVAANGRDYAVQRRYPLPTGWQAVQTAATLGELRAYLAELPEEGRAVVAELPELAQDVPRAWARDYAAYSRARKAENAARASGYARRRARRRHQRAAEWPQEPVDGPEG